VDDADPAVVARNRQAVEALERRGATVKQIRLPNLNWMRLSHAIKVGR
jgi:hypothetical protein